MLPDNFWEPLEKGWFLRWAVEMSQREHPNSSIVVMLGDLAICGSVPDAWDRTSRVVLKAKE